MSTNAPHAPWALMGECIVGVARRRSGRGSLPPGLHPLPGPALVVGSRYIDSPVGPYLELAVGEPARVGARPGMCITTTVVDSPDSRTGGRLNWGYPRELGTLRWRADGDHRELSWEERGIVLQADVRGRALPVRVRPRSLQRRVDAAVVVPARLKARARRARVLLEVPDDDALAFLAGPHPGAVAANVRFVVEPARLPSGLRATLRAPLRAPEPALASAHSGE